jgi:putative sigma-54 modulation protein
MNIIINGKQLDITPAIRSYSEDKIKKFDKYIPNINEAVVTLSVEKYRHKAEVLLRVNGVMLQAESVTEEIYSSIDEVAEKMERQAKKQKEKITSRRKDSRQEPVVVPEEGLHETSERIILKKKLEMKPMSPEEAAMQMDLGERNFFVFINDKTSDINVIYKTNSGDCVLIEPVK